MSQPTDAQRTALRRAMQVLIDAVKEAGPTGAPGGVMYAALLGKLTLAQFERLMGGLVSNGNLRKQGELYVFVRDLEVRQ